MSEIHVVPAGIRQFADTNAEVAAQLTSAGGFDLAANTAAAAPVFGAIGADFLAIFAVAQANHAKAIADLAAGYACASAAAHASADGYVGTDAAHTTTMTGLGREIGPQA
ncbi:MAG: ESX-1 secretion-associated protein [Aldersonia sp.]|nr:ESX-1 secretion-associated protein [Aldersonia sp.]